MEKLFLFKAVPFDKTDDSITEEYLIFNNKPSFENLKKAFEESTLRENVDKERVDKFITELIYKNL